MPSLVGSESCKRDRLATFPQKKKKKKKKKMKVLDPILDPIENPTCDPSIGMTWENQTFDEHLQQN